MNKITSSCEICSGPHDTQYYMENPEQAFVEYASSRTDEAGEGLVSNFMASQDARLSKFEADFKQKQSEMSNKIDTVLKAITDRIAGALPSDTVKNLKLNTSPVLSARDDGDVMFVEIVQKRENSRDKEPEAGEQEVEYFDTFLTRSELVYHKNEEDMRIGVEYVMNKILGFYKECLELGPEYVTGMDDEGEVT
ncbi:hypothetical protein Tco_0277785 [Tanacetum coccineum]